MGLYTVSHYCNFIPRNCTFISCSFFYFFPICATISCNCKFFIIFTISHICEYHNCEYFSESSLNFYKFLIYTSVTISRNCSFISHDETLYLTDATAYFTTVTFSHLQLLLVIANFVSPCFLVISRNCQFKSYNCNIINCKHLTIFCNYLTM